MAVLTADSLVLTLASFDNRHADLSILTIGYVQYLLQFVPRVSSRGICVSRLGSPPNRVSWTRLGPETRVQEAGTRESFDRVLAADFSLVAISRKHGNDSMQRQGPGLRSQLPDWKHCDRDSGLRRLWDSKMQLKSHY